MWKGKDMRFEAALRYMREGKKVVNEFGLHTEWIDVFYIEDGELTSDRYEDGYLVEKNIPVMLPSVEIMSEDWEVVDVK